MTKQHISEFDIFYISYDEPNAEENWAKLSEIAPWAQRVHGVKGFDSAHKACANASTTDRFITVDGDNVVYPEFFDLSFEIPEKLQHASLSWAGKNNINGLVYGNGGLKLWTKEFVLNMKTHEHATRDEEKVDFCWDDSYVQLNGLWSDTCPNGSPFQAFRAGFREGVKMCLDRGAKIPPADIKSRVHPKNLKRLLIWASVGSDVKNGMWAIYGTRLGIYLTSMTDWDHTQVSDYDWFKTFWVEQLKELSLEFQYKDALNHLYAIMADPFKDHVDSNIEEDGCQFSDELEGCITQLGIKIAQATDLKISYLYPGQSAFFKEVYENPIRTLNPLVTEIEVDSGLS